MECNIYDSEGNVLEVGDKVMLKNGQEGEIVFECGAYGVAVEGFVNYDSIQKVMDKDDWCCGNKYDGCFNDNFISLWELHWNSNSDDNCCRFVRLLFEEKG
jgi:hypothetical protein